jgi:SNF2 family DNA or RNA helicase
VKLQTPLMPHQEAAVDKMLPLRVGALFMEMGTGKSRTAIEIAARRFASGKIERVVWFCPVSTKETIRTEITKHVEKPSIYVFHDKTEEGKVPDVDWVIIGLESMSASARVILAAASVIDAKSMVILDESSYIKGPTAERTKWITELSAVARYRMILTGTPVSQGVVDLFSQFMFLDKRIIGRPSFYAFTKDFVVYHKNKPGMVIGAKNLKDLSARLAPFAYQVTKAECLNLPGKKRDVKWFDLTEEQKEAYEQVKSEFEQAALEIWNEEEATEMKGRKKMVMNPAMMERRIERRVAIEIFRMFSRLQQVTCGFLDGEPLKCNRLDALEAAVLDIPDTEKVIVWTKYRKTFDDIVAKLQQLGEVASFHGGLNEKARSAALAKFRSSARFLVATTQCGGHGLTLNESSNVIFYANEFKYSTRAQAEDRCHRIGQERMVTYTDIAATKSIDARILDALQEKKNVAREFREKIQKVRSLTKMREALKNL